MVSVIACALVSSFSKFMFTKMLNEMDKVDIGGAPSWYMKPMDDKMCTFDFEKGDLQSIEIAKINAKTKMQRKINTLVDISIYETTKNVKDPKVIQMTQMWSDDPNLSLFVTKHLDYSKIVYEDEINTSFVRACIDAKVLTDYQQERLDIIQKDIMKYKANVALDELESELEKNNLDFK